MSIKDLLNKSEFVSITNHEYEILRHLYNFMSGIDPLGLDTIDKEGPCDSCENYWNHLYDAYCKAINVFKFSLIQILIRNDHRHLIPLVKAFNEDSFLGITFVGNPIPEGELCYYISLSGLAE